MNRPMLLQKQGAYFLTLDICNSTFPKTCGIKTETECTSVVPIFKRGEEYFLDELCPLTKNLHFHDKNKHHDFGTI